MGDTAKARAASVAAREQRAQEMQELRALVASTAQAQVGLVKSVAELKDQLAAITTSQNKLPLAVSPDDLVAQVTGGDLADLKVGEQKGGIKTLDPMGQQARFKPNDIVRLKDDTERARVIRSDKVVTDKDGKPHLRQKGWPQDKPIVGAITAYRWTQANGARGYSVRFPGISDSQNGTETCLESEVELVRRA